VAYSHFVSGGWGDARVSVYKYPGRFWLDDPENGFSDGPFQTLAEALTRGGAQLTEYTDSIDYNRREIRLRDLLDRLEVVTDGFRGVAINGVPYRLDGERGWARGEPPEDLGRA